MRKFRSLYSPRLLVMAMCFAVMTSGCVNTVVDADDGDETPEQSFATDEIAAFGEEERWSLSPTLMLDEGANRVALMANLKEGGVRPRLQVRGVDNGVYGPLQDVQWTFDELGHLAGRGELEAVYVEVQVGILTEHRASIDSLTFAPRVCRRQRRGLDPGRNEPSALIELGQCWHSSAQCVGSPGRAVFVARQQL